MGEVVSLQIYVQSELWETLWPSVLGHHFESVLEITQVFSRLRIVKHLCC